MKASRLFSLVAMAALAVGCTQEEFVPAGENAAVDLSNRPSLGDVVLDMGTQTRMAIADGSSLRLAWADGDQIGASIIDEPNLTKRVSGKNLTSEGGLDFSSLEWTYKEYANGVEKRIGGTGEYYSAQEAGIDPSDFYDMVEYVSSNYPYTYANGIFDTPANLVEGNYMFYAPYNEQNLMRERVKAVLPMVQDCSDAVMKNTNYTGKATTVSSTALDKFYKGTMEGFAKAPVAVGYKFLAAPTDGSIIKPSVVMSHLFAYPMITIVNDFDGFFYGENNVSTSASTATTAMTIDSIQIYHNDATNNLFYTAAIKSEDIASTLAEDHDWDNKRFTEGSNTSDLLDDTDVNLFYPGHRQSVLQEPLLGAANTALAYKRNHVTCVLNKTLENGESYHFHAILPAADYGTKENNKGLKARVFVTIGEKRYVIVQATNTVIGSGNNHRESSAWEDFVFEDNVNGGENCVLIRGEHYPKAEFQENGEGTKAFAGTMLTLNLKEGTAFELKTADAPTATNSGFKNNEEFIQYLIANVQRGVALTEVAGLNNVAQENWKTTSVGGVPAAAGNFAFATDTKCIIDAQLIKDLVQQTIITGSADVKLTLTQTSLPIADDVKYSVGTTSGGTTTYTFTTLDDDAVEYQINMTDGVVFGDDGEELVSGINNIGTTSQGAAVNVGLKVGEGVTNAVVYLQGAAGVNGTTATLTDCTGISAIYVNENTTLRVQGVCTAVIIANGGTINIDANGSLTNENNEFNNNVNIINGFLRTVNGEIGDNVTVSAILSAWPTQAISAASRINTLTIDVATSTNSFSIEQAQMDVFANLTDGVALTLGSNITGIVSANNVTLTNLKSLSAPATVQWGSNNSYGITVTGVEIDGTKTSLTNIASGTGVTFANVQ